MARTIPSIPRWFTRASAIASLGVAAAGCSGSVDKPPEQVDSGVPDATSEESADLDSGVPDATSDEPIMYYGPVPVDAADEDPATYYGPIPVDGG
ncbi:MAG: hypothetical protein MUF54_06890 [Polyangiaceae bacterium]|nr:hypothetical protein [Polyangiaceae bacterium]